MKEFREEFKMDVKSNTDVNNKLPKDFYNVVSKLLLFVDEVNKSKDKPKYEKGKVTK